MEGTILPPGRRRRTVFRRSRRSVLRPPGPDVSRRPGPVDRRRRFPFFHTCCPSVFLPVPPLPFRQRVLKQPSDCRRSHLQRIPHRPSRPSDQSEFSLNRFPWFCIRTYRHQNCTPNRAALSLASAIQLRSCAILVASDGWVLRNSGVDPPDVALIRSQKGTASSGGYPAMAIRIRP